MRSLAFTAAVGVGLILGCSRKDAEVTSLGRHSFKTEISTEMPNRSPPPKPPPGEGLEGVKFKGPLGQYWAYASVAKPGSKRPAMVWLTGGFNPSIGATAWQPAMPHNDQSARVFRDEGAVLILPSTRGGNDNPGKVEWFLGEVDDVLAAIEYARGRPDVDPEHVYLGGHSTGATLALLVAANGPKVRGVFVLGPVDDVAGYKGSGTPLDGASDAELTVRSPVRVLSKITAPTLIVEGDSSHSNVDCFPALQKAKGDAPITFEKVKGHDHFSVIRPASAKFARQMMAALGQR